MIAFSFLLAGCDKEMESLELDNAALKSAGTRNVVPNTFDAVGKYCGLAIQTPPDYKGSRQMELWMGVGNEKAGTLVGYVRFEPGKVIIDLTDSDQNGKPDMYPYVIEEIHIHFASTAKGIPQTKNGNPIPGKFEYNITPENYGTKIEIPNVVFEEFGAIHLSVVKFGGIDGFEFYLPNDPVKVTFKYPAPNSYLEVTISGANAGALAGTYENWCVNTGIGLDPSKVFDALLYSSYEPIPNVNQIVKKPENFDLINYLINNYSDGTVVELKDDNCDTILDAEGNPVSEAITWQDIQKAIWYIIDGGTADFYQQIPTWKQERVNSIVCEVQQNGEGFEPECNEKIVFVVVPINIDEWPEVRLIVGQPTVSSVPVPCFDEGGTAWGDGYYGATFGGAQWGTWFKYDASCK